MAVTRTGIRFALACVIALGLSATTAAAQPKRLLAHYMPWYKTPEVRGSWGPHWTGFQNEHNPDQLIGGLPDIYSHYHPLIGLYDSTDRDVIECQLLQMKFAGIDGVIADWYGLSSTFDYDEIHEATLALFAETERVGLSFSVCFEDRTIEARVNTGALSAGLITTDLINTFQWMDTNWFSSPHYERFEGQPLLLNFGPIYVTNPTTWDLAQLAVNDPPRLFSLHNLWQGVQADGGFNWMVFQAWNNNPPENIVWQRLVSSHRAISPDPSKVMPSAVPGYKDIYAQSFGDIPHRGGDTMTTSLEAAMADDWTHIQLATWNDYGEGTIIEPTVEFGYTFLERIQQERLEEQGAAFPFGPDDLRLPARLLALRQAGDRDPCLLAEISAALIAGDTETAAGKLDVLEADSAATCSAACPPDVNGDGVIDNGDIGGFISLFLSVDLAADFNGDGILDNGDIGAFITAFLTGC